MATLYSLTSLGDHALRASLETLVTRHREITARLLAHLAEFDERRLYRAAGYASIHAYCVGALRFSEDAAYKRIQVARAAREFPVMFEMLADGRLHVSGALLLAPKLLVANAWELLEAAAGRTKSGIELLLAERFPQPDVPTVLRPIAPAVIPDLSCQLAPGRVGMTLPEHVGAATSAIAQCEALAVAMALLAAAPSPVAAPAPRAIFPRVAPLSPERCELHATISRETHEKLRRAQELLDHTIPSGDMSEILDRALALLVSQLEKRRCGATDSPRPRRSHANGRYVPAEVRRGVFERDGHQCTHVSDKGHRCEARSRLELDHVIPLARGGRTEAADLRLLCRQHNQHEAESAFGAGFMRERGARPGESSASRGTRIDAHSQRAT